MYYNKHNQLDNRTIALLTRFINDKCTLSELEKVKKILQSGNYEKEWKTVIDEHAINKITDEQLNENFKVPGAENLLKRIRITAGIDKLDTRHIILWRWIGSIAASVILISAVISFANRYYLGNHQVAVVKPFKNDIPPGSNKAILTLGNGHKIILADAKNGQLADDANTKITKAKDGRLIYNTTANSAQAEQQAIDYNTISTPNGGQYEVVLPDGTKVWLNASSSLRYPTRFMGNERKVELWGEAYFEVAHNKAMPFKVKTVKQEIEVLGTHFNVNAYTDEPATKTTLLEGSVKITAANTQSVVIKPNQQALLNSDGFNVHEVDADEFIAWKNGYFEFSEENLGSIMRKISRWYNVEIVYTDEGLENQVFSGSISKYKNVSQVIKLLELTSVANFNIQGNRIIITHS
jgi:transmembrane sensor